MKLKLLIGGLIAALALGVLLVFLFRSSTPYVMSVSQLMAEKSRYEGKSVRLEGTVVNETIDWNSGRYTLIFYLKENQQQVLVYYDGERPDPDKFIGGIKIMAEGRYRQEKFLARTFTYECPSEYQDK